MTTERHNDPDILESALRELRGQGNALGPSPQALARTGAAMRAAGRDNPGQRLAERISLMKRLRRPLFVTAAAAAVLIAFAVWMLLPSDGKTGVAFADVRRQIEQTQTMTVTCAVEMKGMKKPMTMKFFLKDPGLMRQEVTWDMGAMFEATLPAEANHPATKPATVPATMNAISIFDMTNQKGLSLIPSQKKAIVFEFKNMPPEAIDRTKKQNVLEQLKKSVAGEHQDLGEKTIEGRKAKGYRCKNPDMEQATMDIWVDASTGAPLRVEQTTPESLGGIKVTMTDFVMNPKLDDSLFDTKVPEGYTVENQAVDFSVTEEDLIKGLGLFAKYGGGAFPKSLMVSPEMVKQLMDLGKLKKISEEEGKEFGARVQKVMMFQMKAMQGGEFVYAGEGVKLGDKAPPILWYKAKDAKTYRVIYGDLHVEDAQAAPKRPDTRPAPPEAPAKLPHP